MPDLQNIANPYDFANPVPDSSLFIGRKEELSEIRYYLSQALKARRPTNIAFVGNRASGKTSLLNITEEEAKKLGLLTVRIDLDESDASSQWAFFFKIFDSLFCAACETGAYGGKHSQTFDTYIDMTCSLVIPADKTFCPFLFPIQYAMALNGNNWQTQVPDYGIRRDLEAIQTEVKQSVVILIDEGNVLSKSRVHLQKLRNIFMNSRGYMLILTGTPEMFPVMDEVFSPIIRQFKKIAVNQFQDVDETEKLIRTYLETSKVSPEAFFEFEDSSDLEDIHALTGGRPYEIQLVCHTLFRRVQQGRAQKMGLDLGVIEEVRQQLESSQKLADRPILNKIRTLNAQGLEVLSVFAPCVDSASFQQVSALEHIFPSRPWEKDQLNREFLRLKDENILGETAQGIVEFRGDDFDKIYTKYYSAERDVSVQFSELPLPIHMRIRLDHIVRATAAFRSVRPIQSSERVIDVKSLVEEMGKASSNPNVYVETPIATLRSLYRLLFEFRGDSELTLIDCSFNILGSDIQGWYVPRKKADKEAIDACLLVLQAVRSRAIAVECACSFQTIQIAIPPLDRILHGIVSGGNRRFAEIIAENHMESLARAYTANRISPDLDEHAGVALHLRDYLSPPALNNLGYYYFAKGQVENSKSLLEQSIALAKKNQIPFALASFNLAMIYFVIGDRVKAIDILRETTVGLEDEKPDCLFVPKVSSKGVDLIEVRKGLDLELERQSALNLLRDSDPTPQVN